MPRWKHAEKSIPNFSWDNIPQVLYLQKNSETQIFMFSLDAKLIERGPEYHLNQREETKNKIIMNLVQQISMCKHDTFWVSSCSTSIYKRSNIIRVYGLVYIGFPWRQTVRSEVIPHLTDKKKVPNFYQQNEKE